jgi:aminomethyltransferase
MTLESPIYDRHTTDGAFFIPYGPEDAPIPVVETFGDLDMEYAALRKGAVIFDMPHVGTIRITGSDRLDYLNNMLTCKLLDMTGGDTRSCFWLNRKGRINADLCLSQLEDEMLVSVDRHLANATVKSLLEFVFAEDVDIVDASESLHHISIHGPTTFNLLSAAADKEGFSLALDHNTTLQIDGCTVYASRTTLTGETGIELCMQRSEASKVYECLMNTASANLELKARATGWLALNAARVESGNPMFNIDFGSTNVPAESGIIESRVNYEKGCYLGQEVVARMHARGIRKQTIVALRIDDQQITTEHTEVHQPTAGGQVFVDSESPTDPIGCVTSSTISPMLGAIPICFAMLKDAYTKPGTKLRVLAEGTLVNAVVQPDLVFYSKP